MHKLNEAFDIIDLVPSGSVPSECGELVEYSIKEHKISAPRENELEADYSSARDNLYTLLQLGEDALIQALNVAKQSENPRAFEVVGNIMKQLSDINHQLLDLHKKKQSVSTAEVDSKPKTVTNNSIFVGSTAELSKMIANMKKGE